MAPVTVTTQDKLTAILCIARGLTAAIYQLLTAPVRSGPKPKVLYKDVMYALFRSFLANMSVGAEKFLDPGTDAHYLEFCTKKNFQPDTLVLPSGTKAHWLGPRKTEKVIVWFHGGGYVMSCGLGHFSWFYNVTKSLAKTHSVSSILLSYTCAPEGQYPTQLKQAAELLKHLIEVEGRKPSDIIIGGDSAGGNLTVALLSHILHPHPKVPTKISLNEPLLGAVLISPWLNFTVDDPLALEKENTDYVSAKVGTRWSNAFLGSSPKDNYNQPSMAEPSWFEGLEGIVKDILVEAGGGEMMVNGINEVVKSLQGAHKNITYFVTPNAAHEECIMEVTLGYKNKSEGTVVIEEWVGSKL